MQGDEEPRPRSKGATGHEGVNTAVRNTEREDIRKDDVQYEVKMG
jgi:hypothetical protein